MKDFIVYFTPYNAGGGKCLYTDCYLCPLSGCSVYPDGSRRVEVTENEFGILYERRAKLKINEVLPIERRFSKRWQ